MLSSTIVVPQIPSHWVSESVIMERFLIQTPPISTMGCMRDYVHLQLVKAYTLT